MSEMTNDVESQPQITRRKSRISWIWLIPIIAALAGATLVVRTWMDTGPRVTITFKTASGLEVGKTQIRYKDVTVGVVSGIRLSEDWGEVIVTADISRDAAELAREGTRFWVVRPRLALSGISGLGTLLSGVYLAVDAPTPQADDNLPQQRVFTGLEEPPEITHDRPGRTFHLKADDIGSLEVGSPVYFRHLNVGRVIDYDLDEDGQGVDVEIFMDAPNDRFVTAQSRFWNASGLDINVGADGLQLRTESLVSVLLGGIAFDSPNPDADPAPPDTEFRLYDNVHEAQTPPDGPPWPIRMRFDQSVRGLSVGAQIEFRGLKLGEVTHISLEFDNETKRFYTLVDANLFPQRMGPVYERMRHRAEESGERDTTRILRGMIEHGLRAQLRTANLLTGQLFVVLDMLPDVEKVTVPDNWPIMVPTVPGEFDQIQQQVLNIIGKLEKMPLEEIGNELRTTLASAGKFMTRLDRQIAPEAQAMLRQARRSLEAVGNTLADDATLPINAERTLQELARAARSLRQLADYLQANPEALLRGRNSGALPN